MPAPAPARLWLGMLCAFAPDSLAGPSDLRSTEPSAERGGSDPAEDREDIPVHDESRPSHHLGPGLELTMKGEGAPQRECRTSHLGSAPRPVESR